MVEDAHQMRPSTVTDEQYLNQAETEIRRHSRHVLSSIVAIGKKLTEVKGRLGHGRYGQFIRDRLGFSERTAQQFVQCYEFIKSAQCADLDSLQIDPSALRLLARQTTSEGVRVRALEQAAKPEGISVSEVKKLIAEAEAVKAQDEAEKEATGANATEVSSALAGQIRGYERAIAQREEWRQGDVLSPQDQTSAPEATIKESTATEELVAEATEPPDPPIDTQLSSRATVARQALIHCAIAIKLTPGELIAVEPYDLVQMDWVAAQVNVWCTEYIQRRKKKIDGEQPSLPFDTLPFSRKR
jgi:hypothetical protein